MIKSETYTENEIQILKDYYSDKVINQLFDLEHAIRITGFDTKKANNGKLFLNCIGYFVNQPYIPEISIKLVAETLGLKLPHEVLSNLNEDA